MPASSDGKSCDCGKTTSTKRIVGGVPTNIFSYPWMVQFVFNEGNSVFCGGSIINDLYILTAAHCVEYTSTSEFHVLIGHTSSGTPGKKYEVECFYYHERYRSFDITKYDIALLRLKEPLEFSDEVSPICLPYINDFEGKKGQITGWGLSSVHDFFTEDNLMVANVTIMEFRKCQEKSKYEDVELNELILCARDQSIDSCQGDSGGPLSYLEQGVNWQAGIVSWGIGCAEKEHPGVYTKVSKYRDWIHKKTTEATYCNTPFRLRAAVDGTAINSLSGESVKVTSRENYNELLLDHMLGIPRGNSHTLTEDDPVP